MRADSVVSVIMKVVDVVERGIDVYIVVIWSGVVGVGAAVVGVVVGEGHGDGCSFGGGARSI